MEILRKNPWYTSRSEKFILERPYTTIRFDTSSRNTLSRNWSITIIRFWKNWTSILQFGLCYCILEQYGIQSEDSQIIRVRDIRAPEHHNKHKDSLWHLNNENKTSQNFGPFPVPVWKKMHAHFFLNRRRWWCRNWHYPVSRVNRVATLKAILVPLILCRFDRVWDNSILFRKIMMCLPLIVSSHSCHPLIVSSHFCDYFISSARTCFFHLRHISHWWLGDFISSLKTRLSHLRTFSHS